MAYLQVLQWLACDRVPMVGCLKFTVFSCGFRNPGEQALRGDNRTAEARYFAG